MRFQPARRSFRFPHTLTLACLIVLIVLTGVSKASAIRATRPKTTQAEAIAKVNSLLQANTAPCKLKHGPVTAKRVAAGWRVTTKVTLPGGGRPFTSTAVWTVGDGEPVPGNQLTSEISNGCP
jgi:hypothetical protein